MKKKSRRKTNYDEEIKEISKIIQNIMNDLDYIKKVSEVLTSEIRKTLVVSYM